MPGRGCFLALAVVLLTSGVGSAAAQGLAPLGRTHTYGVLSDSTVVTHSFASTFSDSTLYTGVDSFVVRRQDVIRSAWSRSFQDSLVQWFRNSDPGDPVQNQVQLVGFERPGLRVFYEPPLPWIASVTQLSAGDSTWAWSGKVWPTHGTGLPDSLTFRAQAEEPVLLFDGTTIVGWRILVEEPVVIPTSQGEWVDLAGRLVPVLDREKAFAATTSWYGAYNDGGSHWVLLRDAQLALLPDRATPVRRESMGSWRARYGGGSSPR